MTPREAVPAVMAPLFEGAPRFLARLQAGGPYRDDAALFEAPDGSPTTMPEEDQIELVDAHPRLGAPPGTVSAMSSSSRGTTGEPARPATSMSPPSWSGSTMRTRHVSGSAIACSWRDGRVRHCSPG